MNLVFEFRSKYTYKTCGNDRYYPISEDAKTICAIMKRKSCTPAQIEICKNRWGVEIKPI